MWQIINYYIKSYRQFNQQIKKYFSIKLFRIVIQITLYFIENRTKLLINKIYIPKRIMDHQISCECSLVSIQLRFDKKSGLYEIKQRNQSRDSTNSNCKSKISLSKTKSRLGSIYSKEELSQQPSRIKNVRYSSDIASKYSKKNVCIKNVQSTKNRKNFAQIMRQKQIKKQKHNQDLEKTQHTTFNNSSTNSTHLYFRNERMGDTVSFFGQKKSDSQKNMSDQQIKRYSCNSNQANIYSKQYLYNTDDFNRFRPIKTLKQLQFKNAQSSGKMTSENHMSMALIAFDQPNPTQLKALNGLLHRKTSSPPFYGSRTQKMVH